MRLVLLPQFSYLESSLTLKTLDIQTWDERPEVAPKGKRTRGIRAGWPAGAEANWESRGQA